MSGTSPERVTGRLPDFLVIGAARCGTTALSRWLDDHDDVWIARQKELRFFDVETNWARGLDWYRDQFADAPPDALVGEASPGYLYVPEAAPRIAETVPDARLVAILRDPIERAWSHYWFLRASDGDHRTPLEAVRSDDRRWVGYLDRGDYLPQLERICEHHPRERLLVVLFDDLRDDPVGLFRTVADFIGAGGDVPESVGVPANAPYEIRFPWWRGQLTYRLRMHERAPRLARTIDQRVLTRPIDFPDVDPVFRRALVPRFADGNAALGEWLGRDLSHWNES